MKFYDLIHKHPWENIRTAIVRLYPDYESELEGYQQVFQELNSLSPIPSTLQLKVELVYSEHAGEFHVEVKGLGPSNKDGTQAPFALGLTPWEAWLGMEIEPFTLTKFSEFDLIAHCLYAMTFFGFTQEDIQKAAKAVQTGN